MLFDCSYCEEAFDNLLSARNHEIDKHAKQYHYKAGKESLAFVEKLQREITLTLVEARQHFDAAAKEDNNDS